MNTYFTGDDVSDVKGLFKCNCCTEGYIRMNGNFKDKFPPCPYSRLSATYTLVFVSNSTKSIQKKKHK